MADSLLIYGAGGHGRVVAETAQRAGFRVAAFLDANAELHHSLIEGLAVLQPPGTREAVRLLERSFGAFTIGLALGLNNDRQSAALSVLALDISLATIVSCHAVVSASASIGHGSVVMPGTVINAGATLGCGVIVNTGAVVEHDCRLGDFVHLSPRAVLGGGVTIGPLAHIALGATIIPRISIGARTTVGAGSVATRDLPDDVTAFGCPARIRRPASNCFMPQL